MKLVVQNPDDVQNSRDTDRFSSTGTEEISAVEEEGQDASLSSIFYCSESIMLSLMVGLNPTVPWAHSVIYSVISPQEV